MRRAWSLGCVSIGWALAAREAAAVPLLTGFGGPSGYGLPAHCLSPSDDGSYAGREAPPGAPAVAVDLAPAFPNGVNFFGAPFRAVYINTNGTVSFREPLAAATPTPFPVMNQPLLAPWWADVDTTAGGAPTRNVVCFHVDPERFVVTWHDVGYGRGHADRVNDFQMILSRPNVCVAGSMEFVVEYRYNRCEWTTGDASGGVGGLGGTPAQVGFDAGNRRNFVSLPMSRSMAIVDMCRRSNVPAGPPGLWRFEVRSGLPVAECFGDGVACALPGRTGICAAGINRCTADAGVTCQRLFDARAERCNGMDDDCDGVVDEGEGLCPGGRRCVAGLCAAPCASGAPCAAGFVCAGAGVCVEAACEGRPCAEGERCVGGACVGPCEGVVCPVGEMCRAGWCVDGCADVRCPVDRVCDRSPDVSVGQCVYACHCTGCAAGRVCGADGRCVEAACEGVRCAEGQVCADGRCVDGCIGVRCPPGSACSAGACTASQSDDAGVGSDADEDAMTDDDATADVPDVIGTSTEDVMTTAPTRRPSPRPTWRGCSCDVAARGERGSGWRIVLVLAAFVRRGVAGKRSSTPSGRGEVDAGEGGERGDQDEPVAEGGGVAGCVAGLGEGAPREHREDAPDHP